MMWRSWLIIWMNGINIPSTVIDRLPSLTSDIFQKIFENVNDPIMIHREDTTIIDLNAAACEMFGYGRERLQGGKISEISPFDRPLAPEQKMELETKRYIRFERDMLRSDGTHRHVEISNAILEVDGENVTVAIMRDLSERYEAQERLKESEERYRILAANLKDAIYRIRLVPDFKIEYVSSASINLIGYTPDELRNMQRPFDIIHPEDLHHIEGFLPSAMKRSLFDLPLVIRLRKKDGTYIWADLRSTPIQDPSGMITAIEGTVRDVTSEKLAKEALERRIRFDNLLKTLSSQFMGLQSNEIDEGISYALSIIGEFVGADRCYIFKVSDIDRSMSVTHDWTAPGVQSQMDRFQNVPISNFPWLESNLIHMSVLHIADADNVATASSFEREFLAEQSIKTIAVIPSTLGQELKGLVGFDTVTKRVNWDEEVLSLMRFCGEMLTNVIDRQQMENRLAEEKERLAVTLRSIGEGVITTDMERRVMLLNKVAEELTGWRQEEAFEKPVDLVFNIIDEVTRKRCENPAENVIRSGEISTLAASTLLVSKNGTERSIADSAAPIYDSEGKTIGMVLVFRDVTTQKRMEEKIANAQKLEAVGTLAGGIAHDFNNMLTAIMGNIGVARLESSQNQVVESSLRETEKAIMRAKDLTGQLLTFSKGGAPIKKVTSLPELLKDTVDFALTGSNVKCEHHFAEDLNDIEVDPGQISQVIGNLVVNAKEAMPDGGAIKITAENVLLGPEDQHGLAPGAYVRLDVSDNGPGIPPEIVGRIFDPYFTTKPHGNGLGLSIAYSIITKHDGSLRVRTRPGIGTVFTIMLPSSKKAKSELPTREDVHGNGRILLMDDEEGILEVTGDILRHLGYKVIAVRDGQEAIASYSNALYTDERFDAVIMDLTIPGGMGGKDAIKYLQELDPGVKAIVSSGYSNDPVMSDHLEHGFKGIIPKPYSIEELSQVVDRVIRTPTIAR